MLYCAHEYTAANAKFALHADPDNAALATYVGEVTARRARGEPTVPMKLARERATNPVLRADDPALLAGRASQGAVDDLDAHLGAHLTDDLAHPEANLAVEHLEPALGRPDEMVAMVKSRVATGGVADSLWLKPVSD